MAMVKQIVREMYYERKQNKKQYLGDFVVLGFILLSILGTKQPYLAAGILIIYSIWMAQKQEKTGSVEILHFLPMNAEELWNYVQTKASIKAVAVALSITILYLLVICLNPHYQLRMASLEGMIYSVVPIFLSIQLRNLAAEAAKRQHMKSTAFLCRTGRYRSNLLFWMAVMIGVFVLGTNWLYIFDDFGFAGNTVSMLPMRFRIVVYGMIALQLLMYGYVKKTIYKGLLYGDNNVNIKMIVSDQL